MNPKPRPSARRLAWFSAARHVLFAVCCAVVVGHREPAQAQPVDFDPPSRVARLSEVVGTVWLYRPDNGDWVQADRNQPLTTGDRLATEPGARAELQIGSTTLRLDSGSDVTVAALDDARISLQLQAGALALRVRDAGEAGPLEVLTPEGRFSVLRAGAYRFDRGSRSSLVGVESGQVRYDYAASALTVDAGQRGEFWLDAGGAAQYALLAPLNDAFAAWNRERDRSVDLAAASRFVSPEVTGAADLVRYGNWEQTPDYGAVWFPAAVAADWAPYSTGRWAFVRPWGWTWVDDAPWGFAPFHYGRWVRVHERWCWTPGARAPRPVYAPALVGWVGGRPDAQGGFPPGSGSAVGWVPLAPREVYVPSYRTSPRYARDVNINITNVTRVDSITRLLADPRSPRDFENRRVPHAVTIVPAAVLAERRPVGPAAAPFRDAPWARDFAQRGVGSVVLTAPPVAGPATPGRAADPRGVRPPPGFAPGREPGRDFDRAAGRDVGREPGREGGRDAAADRGAEAGRAGFPPDRTPDLGRAGVPADRGAIFGRPVAPTERAPDFGRPGTPAVAAPAAVEPRADAPDGRGRGAYRGRYGDETGVRPGYAPPVPGQSTTTTAPAPVQPAIPSGQVQPGQRGAPAVEPQEAPRMRSLPVRRGDDRRGEEAGRSEGAAPVGRPPVNAPPPVMPTPAPMPQATPTPAPRPIEPQRPVVTRPAEPMTAVRPEVVVPRPVEAQSPRREPPRAPEAQQGARPAEPPRPAPAPVPEPRVAAPERRGESPQNR